MGEEPPADRAGHARDDQRDGRGVELTGQEAEREVADRNQHQEQRDARPAAVAVRVEVGRERQHADRDAESAREGDRVGGGRRAPFVRSRTQPRFGVSHHDPPLLGASGAPLFVRSRCRARCCRLR